MRKQYTVHYNESGEIAFEGYLDSEEQIIEHQKRLEEIHEQIRSQQA